MMRTTVMQVLAYGPLAVSLIALPCPALLGYGYGYGVSSLYTVAGFTSVALHTALGIAILPVAVLAKSGSVDCCATAAARGRRGDAPVRAVPQTLIKIAPVGIVQLDAGGGLLTANDQWLALSGLTIGESMGDAWPQ